MNNSCNRENLTFFDALPVTKEYDHIILDALLLQVGDRSKIRLVTGNLCFEFHSDDILSVEEQVVPQDVYPKLGVPVRIVLRKGSSIVAAYSSLPYRDLLLKGRKPFAFATRNALPSHIGISPAYREKEKEFLSRYGIFPSASEQL